LGQFEAAARALNAAVELRPSCIEYIHERAKALQMCGSALATEHCSNTARRYGRHPDAILDFTTVLNSRPRFANARFRRAFSYKSLGQFDESAKDFEDARQLQPQNPRLVINYFQMQNCPFIELVCPGQEADVDP
jgi:tetratricopeptide (TPR) repeat protein